MDQIIFTAFFPPELLEFLKERNIKLDQLSYLECLNQVLCLENEISKSIYISNVTKSFIVRMIIRLSENQNKLEIIQQLKHEDKFLNLYQRLFDDSIPDEKHLEYFKSFNQNFNCFDDIERNMLFFFAGMYIISIEGNSGKIDEMDNSFDLLQMYYYNNLGNLNSLEHYYFGKVLWIYGWWKRESGDIFKAQKVINELEDLSSRIQSQYLSALCNYTQAAIYSQSGVYQKAEEYYKKSSNLYKSVGNDQKYLQGLNSSTYDIMALGNPSKALNILTQIEQDYPGNKFFDSNQFLVHKSLVSKFANRLDLALQTAFLLEKKIKISKFDYTTGLLVIPVTDIFLECKKYYEVEKYLNYLKELNSIINMEYITSNYFLLKGKYELQKSNLGMAQESFQQGLISASKPGDYDTLLKLYLSLADTHFSNYKLLEDISILKDTITILKIIIQATLEQDFTILRIRATFLLSDIELLQENPSESSILLNELKSSLNENYEFRKMIDDKIEELKLYKTAKELSENKRSNLVRSIKQALKQSFNFMFVKDLSKIESKFYGIIIMNEGGLPIYNKYEELGLLKDSTIISGLISAVNSFSSDIISAGSGSLQSIKHDKYIIYLENKNNLVFCMIIEKENFDLKNKFYQFILNVKTIPMNIDDLGIAEKMEGQINDIYDKIFKKN